MIVKAVGIAVLLGHLAVLRLNTKEALPMLASLNRFYIELAMPAAAFLFARVVIVRN
jgi:hypothetical protein